MNNIENDKHFTQPWIAVAENNVENDRVFAQPWLVEKNRLMERANVPEEHLKDMTIEQAIFLVDLRDVGNMDAVRKLAEHRELMYTNEIYELFLTDVALFMLNHWGNPDNQPNLFIYNRNGLKYQYAVVGHFGDVDYEDHYEALKGLKLPNERAKTT